MRRHPEPHSPRCDYLLHHVQLEQSGYDLCHRCGGKFAPPGALAERYGDAAHPSSWVTTHVATDLGERRLPCPHDGEPLHAFAVAFGEEAVEIDACPQCHGLWLDHGEGQRLARVLDDVDQARVAAEDRPGGTRSYLFQLFTGLPREVYNPVGKRPVLVLTLIAVNTLLLIAELAGLASGTLDEALFKQLALVSTDFHPVSLISHMFLHAGVWHLFGNMYSLYIFGDNLEDRFGAGRFAALYLASGLGGAALHLLMLSGSGIPVVGASGAIAGVMAAYLVCYPHTKLWMVLVFVRFKLSAWIYLAVWMAMQAAGAYHGGGGIAWWVHVGGFGVGLLGGWWLRRGEGRWAPMTG